MPDERHGCCANEGTRSGHTKNSDPAPLMLAPPLDDADLHTLGAMATCRSLRTREGRACCPGLSGGPLRKRDDAADEADLKEQR
jgi:hypothetical protein